MPQRLYLEPRARRLEQLPELSSLSRLQDNVIVVTFITPEGQIAREKLTF